MKQPIEELTKAELSEWRKMATDLQLEVNVRNMPEFEWLRNHLKELQEAQRGISQLLVAAEGDDLCAVVRTIIKQRDDLLDAIIYLRDKASCTTGQYEVIDAVLTYDLKSLLPK